MGVLVADLAAQQEAAREVAPHLRLLPGGKRFTRVELSSPDRGHILRQARETYDHEHLLTLTRSIVQTGLINAPELASLDDVECAEYLRVLNLVWGTAYTLEDVSLGSNGRREIYIDGHTRTLGGRQALTDESEIPGGWRIVVHYGIPAEEALDRQFSENVHARPETHEDADAVYRYWMFKHGCNPQLTVADFAKGVGRSESTVRDYLRFGAAPHSIQQAVRTNQIVYGIGLLLARAVEIDAISMELIEIFWLPQAKLAQSVDTFRKSLEARIGKARLGQDDLFGELDSESVRRAYMRESRAVVAPELLDRVRDCARYFGIALDIERDGLFGPEGVYSADAVYRALLELASFMERLLPDLCPQVARGRNLDREERALRVLAVTRALLEELGAAPEATDVMF